MIDLNCQMGSPAKSPEHGVMADIMATLRETSKLSRANAEQSSQFLRQAQEVLDAARQQAGRIVAAAHDKGLNEAAKMVREARARADRIISGAREQADQIISEARSNADQIITAARDSQPDQTQAREYWRLFAAACEAEAEPAQTSGEQDRRRYWGPLGYTVVDEAFASTTACLTCLEDGVLGRNRRLDLPLIPLYLRTGDVASPRQETPNDNPATRHIIAAQASDTPVKTDSCNEQHNPEAMRSLWKIIAIDARAFPINTIDTSVIPALSDMSIPGDALKILAVGEAAATGKLMTPHNCAPHLPKEFYAAGSNLVAKLVLPGIRVGVKFPDKCAGNKPALELES